MTLTRLSVFVLVARLGSVKDAAAVLGITEPAVSGALAALRAHYDDPLLTREGGRMELTAGGQRLLAVASQMVALGDEAEAAVRAAKGSAERLRLVGTSTVGEFVSAAVAAAFDRRAGGSVETTAGVAAGVGLGALLAQRLADVALGPRLDQDRTLGLVSDPVMRAQEVVVAAPGHRPRGPASGWSWLVGPRGAEADSDTAGLLRRLRVPDARIQVFDTHTRAWEAAAAGAGVAPALHHLVSPLLRRGDLEVVSTAATPVPVLWYVSALRDERRRAVASSFRRFVQTPEVLALLRSPTTGIPPARFRPPVYVTLWS